MGVVTRDPASVDPSNTWSAPEEAEVLDGVYAGGTTDFGIGPISDGRWGTYGFDAAIPVGATITKVEVLATGQHGPDIPAGNGWVRPVVDGGPLGGLYGVVWLSGVDTTAVIDITADRAWTRADLLDAVFSMEERAGTGFPGSDADFLDAIQVRVTYETVAPAGAPTMRRASAQRVRTRAAAVGPQMYFTLAAWAPIPPEPPPPPPDVTPGGTRYRGLPWVQVPRGRHGIPVYGRLAIDVVAPLRVSAIATITKKVTAFIARATHLAVSAALRLTATGDVVQRLGVETPHGVSAKAYVDDPAEERWLLGLGEEDEGL